MATIQPTFTTPSGDAAVHRSVVWTPMANGDAGAPISADNIGLNDRSVQVNGTFGTGGTVLWEVSNDGTNWFTATTPAGTSISLTAAGLKQIVESALYARPRVSAGDGTTQITVTLSARRSNRGMV